MIYRSAKIKEKEVLQYLISMIMLCLNGTYMLEEAMKTDTLSHDVPSLAD